MSEDTTTRFVEQEIAKRTIAGDETRLLPDRITRRRGYPADNDVPDLTCRMAVDYVDDPIRSHGRTLVRSAARSDSHHLGHGRHRVVVPEGLAGSEDRLDRIGAGRQVHADPLALERPLGIRAEWLQPSALGDHLTLTASRIDDRDSVLALDVRRIGDDGEGLALPRSRPLGRLQGERHSLGDRDRLST